MNKQFLRRNRLANDADVSDDVMKRCVTFLQNRLSPEDMKRFKELVMANSEVADRTDNSDVTDNSDKDEAMDAPPPFKGMPKTGGTMVAQDSRPKSYADRWPNAARIRQGY